MRCVLWFRYLLSCRMTVYHKRNAAEKIWRHCMRDVMHLTNGGHVVGLLRIRRVRKRSVTSAARTFHFLQYCFRESAIVTIESRVRISGTFGNVIRALKNPKSKTRSFWPLEKRNFFRGEKQNYRRRTFNDNSSDHGWYVVRV